VSVGSIGSFAWIIIAAVVVGVAFTLLTRELDDPLVSSVLAGVVSLIFISFVRPRHGRP
jgi:branched-subunit amino acid ABC-type transport system permease component